MELRAFTGSMIDSSERKKRQGLQLGGQADGGSVRSGRSSLLNVQCLFFSAKIEAGSSAKSEERRTV